MMEIGGGSTMLWGYSSSEVERKRFLVFNSFVVFNLYVIRLEAEHQQTCHVTDVQFDLDLDFDRTILQQCILIHENVPAARSCHHRFSPQAECALDNVQHFSGTIQNSNSPSPFANLIT